MADAFGWASLTAQADVLSNSWGLPPFLKNLLPGNGGPQLVEESIAQAITAGRNGLGLPTFFSSGNVGDLPQWPMDIVTEAIAVNSSSMCDERKHPQSCDGEDWWEGNWGAGLDISAPGVKIATCDPSGSYGYESGNYTYTFNGTSSACPNAAGVMALILSVNPSLSFKQAYGLLCTHADKVGGYAYDSTATYGTWSKELGYGRINALNAVAYASITKGVDNDIAIKNNLSNLVIMPSVSGVGQNIRIVLPDENLQINNLNLCVYNVLGQIVHHQRLSSPNNNNNNNNATSKTAINIAAPSLSGLYFVVLLSEVGTPISSGKIMVQ
jgi:subtilisin family serine protease